MVSDWREDAKRRAAIEAVKLAKDGYIVGLGSGSTAAYAVRELGRRVSEEGLRVLGVPTSYQASMIAAQSGLPLTSLEEHPVLDLDIDGADQVDRRWNLIKGGGGCLTREKVVAQASERFVVVIDETKQVEALGFGQPIPIEVLPFAYRPVMEKVKRMGAKPSLRASRGKSGPTVTDNGNFLIDVEFGQVGDPPSLERELKMIPGVVEVGLFIDLADTLAVGTREGVKLLDRSSLPSP